MLDIPDPFTGSEAPPAAAGGAPASQARKLLRRTLSGGALVAALALILFWTAADPQGRPLLWVVAAVLLATVYEASRMGTIARFDVRPALMLAAAAVLLLAAAALTGRAIGQQAVAHGLAPPQGSHHPQLALEAALAVVTALAAYAFSTWRPLARSRLVGRALAWLAVGGVLLFTLADPDQAGSNLGFALLVLSGAALLGVLAVACEPGGIKRLALVAGLALWLVPPLPALWSHWAQWGTAGLIALLLLSKIGDTAAYYAGTAFGRHHPFPRLSPGKTTEGCLASLAAAVLAAGVLHHFGVLPEGRLGLAGALAAGALTNLAAQAGDLLESAVKRRAGVKDSSRVFGPSGGLLDQLDSLLVSIPVAVLTWPWLLGAG